MDIYTDGIREAAFDYGIKRLAHEMDMSESRLYKKLDPDSGVSLTLADFCRINRVTGDARCTQRLLDDLGFTVYPKARAREDESLMDLIFNNQTAGGDLARVVHEAIKDGRITPEELRNIRNAVCNKIDALTALEGELMEMAEPKLAGKQA